MLGPELPRPTASAEFRGDRKVESRRTHPIYGLKTLWRRAPNSRGRLGATTIRRFGSESGGFEISCWAGVGGTEWKKLGTFQYDL